MIPLLIHHPAPDRERRLGDVSIGGREAYLKDPPPNRGSPNRKEHGKTHDRIGFTTLSSVMREARGIDPDSFRRVCAQFATGVAVATVRGADAAPHGLTVNSFTSVSLEPPLILICIGDLCQILPYFRTSAFFAVNFLNAAQQSLAIAFAERTDNRFEGIPWLEAENGSPLLPDSLGWMECRLAETIEAGDHSILLGKVVGAEARSGTALAYFNGCYGQVE